VPSKRIEKSQRSPHDPLDQEAIRMRVRARLALVEEGDYFAVLGVPRGATSYEIRRAFIDLRRSFEPSRLLTAETADLTNDVRTVLEVLDEAYEILKDTHRRERYRRAIEAGPA
jgi:DnaJ-class molecular chaperone